MEISCRNSLSNQSAWSVCDNKVQSNGVSVSSVIYWNELFSEARCYQYGAFQRAQTAEYK